MVAGTTTTDANTMQVESLLQLEKRSDKDDRMLSLQERSLIDIYAQMKSSQAFDTDKSNVSNVTTTGGNVVSQSTSHAAGITTSSSSISSTGNSLQHHTSSSHTPKMNSSSAPKSNRARVQQFLAKKKPASNNPRDKVKAILARQKVPGSVASHHTSTRRANPLADILGSSSDQSSLKRSLSSGGGGAAAAAGASAQKRMRRNVTAASAVLLTLPAESYVRTEDWDSSKDKPLDIPLHSPAYDGNNTLVICATMPASATRFSFNICSAANNTDYNSRNILYHFNPRRARGGQIIQNSKVDERWGIIESLPRFNINFGVKFQLRVTLTKNGFAVFIGEQFETEYQHRVPLSEGDKLFLNVPTLDDYGNAESVVVHSVWWGQSAIPENLADISGTNAASKLSNASDFERKFDIYVGCLPDDTEKADMLNVFKDFKVEEVRLMLRKGYGFVTLTCAEDVERALQTLNGVDLRGSSLRVSKARGNTIAATTTTT